MMKLRFLIFIWILAAVFSSSQAQNLASLIENQPNKEAFWAVTVRNSQGEILEGYNSQKLIIPASNQKLLTTAAFLDAFGSDFRFQTNIYGRGFLKDSIWTGDLIIKGSGDPSINGFHYGGDRYFVFKQLLGQLKASGINAIDGNMIADVSLFDADYYPKGWDWYDFSFYYGVQISPLSFNNNAVDLEVLADGETGDIPAISWFPDSTNYVQFINRQVISDPHLKYDEYYRRALGTNKIMLASSLPKGYFETESLSVENPPMFFLHSFSDYLNENGISFNGELRVSHHPVVDDEMDVLATHLSPDLAELVEWINKESDNFYAEMLLKTLSAKRGDEPGSFEDGVLQVKQILSKFGVDTSYVLMNDGSGLANGNFTQTAIISEVLQKMMTHPEFESFRKSMSVAGIDGTIAYRMKNTPMYGNFRGKSGYVSGVRTLSGYLRAASGEMLIVSIATNHFAGKIRPVDQSHEEILRYLYEKY